jgi:hypothetical protein
LRSIASHRVTAGRADSYRPLPYSP